jgi:aryl-alcohol dehydrogenase-like predicted oxidoreductase
LSNTPVNPENERVCEPFAPSIRFYRLKISDATYEGIYVEYVGLGKSGLKVSRICLGCWSFGNLQEWMINIDKARPIVERAIDLGVTFFDTANSYSRGHSEQILGKSIKGRRRDLVIATKVFFPMSSKPNDRGLSRMHIMTQIDGSLKRLGTDYVDLYQIHLWDDETPIAETLRALDDLVQVGKTMYIGASNTYAWQLSKALWICDRLGTKRFISLQNHYNLCYREEEREMIPLCRDQGVGFLPFSPLARGFLTGKYTRERTPDSVRYRSDPKLVQNFFRPEDFDVAEEVVKVAEEKDVTPAQIALSWLLHKGVVAPVVGATKVQHIEEAVEATSVRLGADDIRRLEAPYKPHPAPEYNWSISPLAK